MYDDVSFVKIFALALLACFFVFVVVMAVLNFVL